MKWMLAVTLSGALLFGLSQLNGHGKTRAVEAKQANSSFALLELFTSEGCSSCPPADRLLPRLASIDQNVIALSFHVDYWNYLGWKDPFGSSQSSNRQQDYGRHFKLESIYTPELVINGRYETVGSNGAAAEATIKKFLTEPAAAKITIDEVNRSGDKLSISCHLEGSWQNSELVAAVVQKHAEVEVKAGENHGLKLSHTNVVRAFNKQNAQAMHHFDIAIPADLISTGNENSEAWGLVLYTQQKDFKITGAATYHLRDLQLSTLSFFLSQTSALAPKMAASASFSSLKTSLTLF